jgi:hypothetical protein
MKSKIRLSTLGIMALILVLSLTTSGFAEEKAPLPVVYLNPTNSVVDITSSTNIEVWVNDVSDFYGLEFELIYDPAIVQALSVVPGSAFTSWPNEYEVVQSNVGGGLVQFAASLLSTPKAPPLSGDLHVATIAFDPLVEGVSGLLWVEIKVSNSQAQAILPAYLDGTITVVYMGDVQGYAYLEGRSNHSGSTVDIVNGTTASTVTASNGYYKFTDVISGLYDVSIAHAMYLDAELSGCTVAGGVMNTLPSVTLLAGDLTNDGTINIFDLTLCAAHFNEVYAAADVNADGIVDIFDVVLIGKNFGISGPIVSACP